MSQVVGAGCSLRREAGNYAGVVKLFRVSVLAVVVAVSSVFKAERRRVQSETAAGTAPARQSLVR